MYPSSCGGLVQSWAQLRGWLALGRASAPPACSCGRRGPGHPVQPRGGTQASRHLALGEASRVLIPGSRGSCPQRSYVCVHGRPGRGQLLGAGLHNGAAVQGCAGPDRHTPCGGDRGPIQHWLSALRPRLRALGVGGPAQTPVSCSGPEAVTWLTLAQGGQAGTCTHARHFLSPGGLP